ncbi:hypothetical protein V8E53_010941 [Lactarius tabidus]
MNFYFTCAQLHSSRRTEVSLAPLGEAKEKKIVLGLATLRPGSSGRMNANASGMAAYHQCPLASLTSLLYGTEALNDVSDVDHPVILFVSLTEADQVTIHLLTKPTNLARTNTDATIKHESNRGLGKRRARAQVPSSDASFEKPQERLRLGCVELRSRAWVPEISVGTPNVGWGMPYHGLGEYEYEFLNECTNGKQRKLRLESQLLFLLLNWHGTIIVTPRRSYNMPARVSQRGMENGNIGGVTIVERTAAVQSIATGDLCRQGHWMIQS